MRQRNLAVSTRMSTGVSSGRVESQYFVGSFSPSGHSMRSHSSGWGVETFQGREARRQDFVRALPPWNDAPSLLGKPPRQRLGGNRDMFAVAAHARWRAPPPAPGFGRQRFGAGGPDTQRRLYADHIGQTAGRDAGAERAIDAIPSVGQQDARSDACCQRGPDLSEGDLGFGPEFHFGRDTNLLRRASSPAQSSGRYSR